MRYAGKVDYAHERKIRERNTRLYRLAHWPIWIWVFFLAPGPLTFYAVRPGLSLGQLGLARRCAPRHRHREFSAAACPDASRAPTSCASTKTSPTPSIAASATPLRGTQCSTSRCSIWPAWSSPSATGVWYMKQIYNYAYSPLCAVILLLGLAGWLPRVGPSTKGEGIERRYFYGSVWAVTAAQTVLLVLWKALPLTQSTSLIKLAAFVGVMVVMGVLAYHGKLGRTRPILPGELMVSD